MLLPRRAQGEADEDELQYGMILNRKLPGRLPLTQDSLEGGSQCTTSSVEVKPRNQRSSDGIRTIRHAQQIPVGLTDPADALAQGSETHAARARQGNCLCGGFNHPANAVLQHREHQTVLTAKVVVQRRCRRSSQANHFVNRGGLDSLASEDLDTRLQEAAARGGSVCCAARAPVGAARNDRRTLILQQRRRTAASVVIHSRSLPPPSSPCVARSLGKTIVRHVLPCQSTHAATCVQRVVMGEMRHARLDAITDYQMGRWAGHSIATCAADAFG
jgi:hypothetical protein